MLELLLLPLPELVLELPPLVLPELVLELPPLVLPELVLLVLPELLLVPELLPRPPELLLVAPLLLAVVVPLEVPDPPPSSPPVASELDGASGAASVPSLLVAPLDVPLVLFPPVVALRTPLVPLVVPPVVGLPSPEDVPPDPPPSVVRDNSSMPAISSHPAARGPRASAATIVVTRRR